MFQKQLPYRNKKILAFARLNPCTINLPGVCNHDPETTVACHISSYELGHGKGVKADDCCIFYGCSSCHDVFDGRTKTEYHRSELKLMHYDGIKRTQDYWLSSGYVVTKNLT